jgi:para-nitrobenzyl esterase
MHRRMIPLLFFMVVLAGPARSDTIRVEGGQISGKVGRNPEISVYKGVRYAAPPVANLRWREAKPVVAWEGVRKTEEYSATCMQAERPHDSVYYPGFEPTSEDCLYANVWTPSKSASDRLPVMVYIHGGGFRLVSGSEKFFDGEALAKQGVIVVTFNYRLGAFGFLAHPELTRESDHHASGNYGLLDQIAAMRWVQKNIAAFGGDPTRVTIFGQSAGANSVCYLLASPLTRGLYIHAIAESVVDCFVSPEEETKLASAEQAGEKFLAAAHAASIADLRAKPAEDILKMSAQTAFGPVIDGYLLPASTYTIFAKGQQNQVNVIVGSNGDEGTLLGGRFPGLASVFVQQARQKYGDQADTFLKFFPANSDAQSKDSNLTVVRDQVASQARILTTRMASTGKVKSYRYFFSHKPPVPNGMFREQAAHELGAFHSSELEYVFHNLDTRPYEWTDTDRKLSDAMSSYWVNFAKTGNPNGKGLPNWPACDAKNDVLLEFADKPESHPAIDKAAVDFLESALAKQHAGN